MTPCWCAGRCVFVCVCVWVREWEREQGASILNWKTVYRRIRAPEKGFRWITLKSYRPVLSHTQTYVHIDANEHTWDTYVHIFIDLGVYVKERAAKKKWSSKRYGVVKFIWTSLYSRHVCSRWYTPDFHVVTTVIQRFITPWHRGLYLGVGEMCPLSNQGVTACFTSTSISNILPARW
jgi:hypothetical protein